MSTDPSILLYLFGNISLIVNNDINFTQTTVSSENASSAQLSLSNVYSKNLQLPDNDLESIINEVALTKLSILNTDKRAINLKNQLIAGNNNIPESVRFSNDQLNSFFPVLAPF